MTTEALPVADLSTFGSPKTILDLLNSANENPQLGAQVDFLVTCWKLAKAVKLAPKIKSSLGSLLEENKKNGVRFDDDQPWDAKVNRLKQRIQDNKTSKAAPMLKSFIETADIVGWAYGEEQKQRFTKLSEPVNSCNSTLSFLRVIVAFSKGEHDNTEQTSSLEQPTQHPNAVPSGSKRAFEHSIEPRPKKQRLEGTDDFAKPLWDDSMRQGRCTVGSSPLLREEAYVPSETLLSNQEPLHSELSKLQYYGEEEIPGTGDIRVVYRWSGRAALLTLVDGCHIGDDKTWYRENIALDLLPFNFLAEIIKQSDRWKKENVKSSEKTKCLQICMYQKPLNAYCFLDCVVPSALVSQCRGIYDMDPTPI
ncbi:uncharacterized protein ALTATR162_LOCUS12128 [Alternaria atra]|uniref:Uncharacterized protein n=1 Tax=Alternaria atra TaxID=119953 RepID=A0A8J2ICS3_9PLEO|nr:uncharacterized protein ALTATR162_LOCUS12128 [Alternaria atra]CAG5190094.1 unnamed protein product [Alternaria atra]